MSGDQSNPTVGNLVAAAGGGGLGAVTGLLANRKADTALKNAVEAAYVKSFEGISPDVMKKLIRIPEIIYACKAEGRGFDTVKADIEAMFPEHPTILQAAEELYHSPLTTPEGLLNTSTKSLFASMQSYSSKVLEPFRTEVKPDIGFATKILTEHPGKCVTGAALIGGVAALGVRSLIHKSESHGTRVQSDRDATQGISGKS